MALSPFCGHYGARDRLVFIQRGSDEPQDPHECRKKAFKCLVPAADSGFLQAYYSLLACLRKQPTNEDT